MSDLLLPLLPWFAAHARDLPWRRANFPAWGTLVSEIMLQQTQAARVAVEIDRWMDRWPTPAALAAADTAEVLRAWGTLGYPRRALRLQDAARAIVERHDGEVPDDVESLLALPGVGDYTARAVASFHFGARVPVVDTNVRRVVARHRKGLAEQGPAKRADLVDVEALLPEDPAEAVVVGAALMELGAIVCTSRTPRCEACPLADGCRWLAAGRPDNAPAGRPRQARFEGSDRQARGRIMRQLRDADGPLRVEDVVGALPDETQARRALEGLLTDGLAVRDGDLVRLP